VAVEGTRGPDVARAAARLWRPLKDAGASGGISAWDASGTFFELRLARRGELTPSPRTLLLLYAADLAFRLRWHIRPALAQGAVIVAAPYVESAIALGEAAGLPRRWLTELFRFAPRPDLCLHTREKKTGAGWKKKWQAGFLEYANGVLEGTRPGWDGRARRGAVVASLERLKRTRRCRRLKRKTVRELR
jgi:hypothetical protein